MFKDLVPLAKELHAETLELYWILITPLLITLVIFEFLRGQREQIEVFDIIRRVAISMILLFTFDYTINVIAMVGDGIVSKVDRLENWWDTLAKLGPDVAQDSSGFFDIRAHIMYVFALVAYMIAYLGFFVAEALTQFVWLILYIISPLMILAYVPRSTANITKSLYKGLSKVIIWKILWAILGVLLLKMAANPPIGTMEDSIVAVIMNLCIGLSMLFIPVFTRSLINDGLETAASAFAAAPALVAAKTAKLYTAKLAKKSASSVWNSSKFAARPITNPIAARFDNAKGNIQPKVNAFKEKYQNINKPGNSAKLKEEKILSKHGLPKNNSKNKRS